MGLFTHTIAVIYVIIIIIIINNQSTTTCRLKYNENRVELLHLPWSIWDFPGLNFKDSVCMPGSELD